MELLVLGLIKNSVDGVIGIGPYTVLMGLLILGLIKYSVDGVIGIGPYII